MKIAITGHVYAKQSFVNHTLFFPAKTPAAAYLLGILWADGFVFRTRVGLEMRRDDLEEIVEITKSTGIWNVHFRQRPNRRPQACMTTTNAVLVDKLRQEYGMESRRKIKNNHQVPLSNIPRKLLHYWFLGLFDGDGSWLTSEIAGHVYPRFQLSSDSQQDWSDIIKILRRIHAEPRISVYGHGSSLRVSSKCEIARIGEFLYQDRDFTGLRRKREKFLEMLPDLEYKHQVEVRSW